MPKPYYDKLIIADTSSLIAFKDIGLVRQPILLNPAGFGLSNKSRKMLRILLFL